MLITIRVHFFFSEVAGIVNDCLLNTSYMLDF